MNIRHLMVPAAFAAILLATPVALGQPVTKLTRNLTSATVKALWCSALFLEESYYWEEESEEAVYYEDMAYDIGLELDDIMAEAGLPQAESEEIWAIFDEDAALYAIEDSDGFLAWLDNCETAYNDNKLKLR